MMILKYTMVQYTSNILKDASIVYNNNETIHYRIYTLSICNNVSRHFR